VLVSEDVAIPPSIELAWGLRAQPTRGPKRGLSLDQVVAAGMDVASSEGLANLSMARVAARLDVSTMSLYRYVSSKDDLVTLMVDAGLGHPPDDAGEHGWRDGLRRWAVGVRNAYRRHPWSVQVPISGPPLGPNNVAWLEYALRCLGEAPLTEQQKLSTVLLLSGFVRNEVILTVDLAAAGASSTPSYGTVLARLTDPARFPAVHRAIDSGALGDVDDVDNEFEFGLGRILDGIDALIEAQLSGQAEPPTA
jgi:AcrR family transcriptional regulator